MKSISSESKGTIPFTPIQRITASAVAVIVAYVFAEASLPPEKAETFQLVAIGLGFGHAAIEAFGSEKSRKQIASIFEWIKSKGGS